MKFARRQKKNFEFKNVKKNIKSKRLKKKRNEKLTFFDKKFIIIKIENYNLNTSIQILQSQMITLKYVIEFIFSNNRFTNFKRIRNNDRIQNVINNFVTNSLIRH